MHSPTRHCSASPLERTQWRGHKSTHGGYGEAQSSAGTVTDGNTNATALRVAKNYTKGYTDTQTKIRDATSNDPWGPSGTQMNEIAQLTYNQCVFTLSQIAAGAVRVRVEEEKR